MKKLYFFLFLAIFLGAKNSFAQCGGVLAHNIIPNDTICAGTQITISGSMSGGGVGWDFAIYFNSISVPNKISDTNSVVVTPFATTTYYIIADSTGCTRKVDTVKITVIPLPTIDPGPPPSICAGQCVQLGTAGGVFYSWSPCAGLDNCSIPNPFTCPASTTTYTVWGTDMYGCVNSNTLTITVNPVLPLIIGPDVDICQGQSAQLNSCGIGAVIYTWMPGSYLSDTTVCNPVTAPLITTTYTLIITDINGCTNSDEVTVTVHQLPPAPVLYCSGDTLFVTADPNYIYYQWYYNNSPISGANGIFYVKTNTGNYSVEVIDVYGCSLNSFTACFLDVEEIGEENFFSIYPNPAHGDFTITFNKEIRNASVEIFNIMGEKVYALQSFSGRIFPLSITEGWSGAGIYFVRVTDEEKIYTKKLIFN